ncbi:Kup system potassium uptake protein [Liberibacter crescens BT-1]|uniref:Probable potassium transport system protein Kup n=1 Tax=Liberibacter crescens (strain BT-1) TaxID=1215343 RepID=L0EVU3_LIBCB|nr:potassium transporter Kup [Liberibacter crescens]AGA64975.1 Kup system potassium uptake protein [Liberibacter crescens BT-1]AMC12994.1 potassium transport protein Kup [Liberibacter crescens]
MIDTYRTHSKIDKYQLFYLTLESIGVVYGDIGTSVLYAFRGAVKPLEANGSLDRTEIIGVTSIMIWILTIIVTIKYVLLFLRADNDGEGGTLSLLALLLKKDCIKKTILIFLGLAGASLFVGDTMVTPALSVLSAIEGLKHVAPGLEDFIMPISIGILVLLFAVQSHGTGAMARFFFPVMIVWFTILAISGILNIVNDWSILAALNPIYAIKLIMKENHLIFFILGSAFLTVTGAEALYTDLGHFGRRPIQYAWMVVVFPALTLNYLGQGALVLAKPEAIIDPFYLMFPSWFLPFAIFMATCATVIASQAVITGMFSLIRQAINLGFFPRMQILFTSEKFKGQVFLPSVNTFLFLGVIAFVINFRSSDALTTAYGISVSGTMLISTMMFSIFTQVYWHWSLLKTIVIVFPILLVEIIFFGANILKIFEGGYIPLLIACICMIIMWTWRRGTNLLSTLTRHTDIPLTSFISSIEQSTEQHAPVKVPGTAIFFTSDPHSVPTALLQNIKHNHVIHEQNIILTINTANKPRISQEKRFIVERISERFSRVEMIFGYMEVQNVSQALAMLRKNSLKFEIMTTSFYLGRRKLVPNSCSGMPSWQDHLFIMLLSLSENPSDYFYLPANRVVELGSHICI